MINGDAKKSKEFKEFQKDSFLSSLLFPFFPFEFKNKNKTEKVVQKILIESLKKSNDVAKFVMGTIPFVQKAIEFQALIKDQESAGH